MAQASHLRLFSTTALLNWPQSGMPAETESSVANRIYTARHGMQLTAARKLASRRFLYFPNHLLMCWPTTDLPASHRVIIATLFW